LEKELGKEASPMIDSIYQALGKMGYMHPLHPPMTHVTIGLIIGVFIFIWIVFVFRRSMLPSLAYQRLILLAFIFAFPTALLGYTDWQYFYDGDWISLIKWKIILTGVLFVLLYIALRVGRRAEQEKTKGRLVFYTLCFLTVTALGYMGGELAYTPREAVSCKPPRCRIARLLFPLSAIRRGRRANSFPCLLSRRRKSPTAKR
jgi:uncharacterized membrane protein